MRMFCLCLVLGSVVLEAAGGRGYIANQMREGIVYLEPDLPMTQPNAGVYGDQ